LCIGASDSQAAEFREMTMEELSRQHSFSDHFRFSFTLRMDRDDALALARKLEYIVSEARKTDCRVYLGVHNDRISKVSD
jgi:hypothetical protein